MTTTHDALSTQEGVRVGFTLQIEGYERVLTDAGPTEINHVAEAYEESVWGELTNFGPDNNFVQGLELSGNYRNAITFWDAKIEPNGLTVVIHDDQFGIDVHKCKPNYRSQINALFEPDADGSGTLTVRSTAPFPESGTVYMGTSRVEYTSKPSGTTFAVSAARYLSPFEADGASAYTGPTTVSDGTRFDAAPATWVADVPPGFIGRRVTLYIHRISSADEAWDTPAQARLIFAGRIRAIKDDPRTGATIVECGEITEDINDAVLMRNQWVGYVKQGIQLEAGDAFYARELLSDVDGYGTSDGDDNTSGELTVVASGASGNDEINAGYMGLEDFIAALNKWVANDSSLLGKWRFSLSAEQGGRRTKIEMDAGIQADPLAGMNQLRLYTNSRFALEFLGFWGDGQIKRLPENNAFMVEASSFNQTVTLASANPPFRIQAFQRDGRSFTSTRTVDLEASEGTFVDGAGFFPAPYNGYPEAGEVWSFFKIGESLYFGKYESANQLTRVGKSLNLASYASNDGPDTFATGLTVDDDGDLLEVQQVLVLSESFTTIVTSLLASTGGGHNHATYDVFPTSVGCPGLPWSLLGDDFVNSCKALEQAVKREAMQVVLEKPTPLSEVIEAELLQRYAWLCWKADGGTNSNGGYHFVSPPTPNALECDHELDMTNIVAPAEQMDLAASSSSKDIELARNVIKVHYNRTPGDKYKSHFTVRDEASITEFKARPFEIFARNSYADAAGTGAAAEDLGASLSARVLPTLSRPVETVRRPIPHTKFHMSPGDTVLLNDDYIRDTTTGERGITDRAAVVLSVSFPYNHGMGNGEPIGEVELLLSSEDRTYPLAPAAEVDTAYGGTVDGIAFTNGYNNTEFTLKLKSHAYGRSTDAVDTTRFSPGDKVRIYEIDPADPASFDAWSRTIASVDEADEYITLTSALSSPSWGGATKIYRIVPQLYADVEDTQLLVAFLADRNDGLIQDEAQPNLYGDMIPKGTFTRADGTALPSLMADEVDDEGRPLHAGLLYDFATMANNLVSYKCAPNQPQIWDTNKPETSQSTYRRVLCFPFYIGGAPYAATNRVIRIGTRLSISDAAQTASVRVTSSRHPPTGTTIQNPVFVGPYRQVTFTRTGSTAAADQTVQELPIVMGDDPGITWLTFEIKSSNGVATATMHGIPTLYLSEIEA